MLFDGKYKNLSEFHLELTMAKTTANVDQFFADMLSKSAKQLEADLAEVAAMRRGNTATLQPWEWKYYMSQKKKQADMDMAKVL
jgi:Zn-dependent oligopeptidase